MNEVLAVKRDSQEVSSRGEDDFIDAVQVYIVDDRRQAENGVSRPHRKTVDQSIGLEIKRNHGVDPSARAGRSHPTDMFDSDTGVVSGVIYRRWVGVGCEGALAVIAKHVFG